MTPFICHIKGFSVSVCALLCAAFSSCIFEYPDESCIDGIAVRFNWINFNLPDNPPGMSVHFYPAGDTDYYGFNLPATGGFVDIPEGTYNVASFNYNSESVFFIGDNSFETLAFTTRPTVITSYIPAPPKSRAELEGQPVMEQPGNLWLASQGTSVLREGDAIELTPENPVAIYQVRVIDVENLHSVSRAIISLSGLAGEYFAASGIAPDESPVILPGQLAPDGASTLSGCIRTFGRAPAASANTLRLYLWLSNGEKKIYDWEVMQQIADSADPKHVFITVNGVSLPDITPPSPPSGSGMEVDVDNWEVINIELST